MAVYNTEEYLDEAVRSVVSQTYSDWELLAIDDGSTDSSGRMLDEWADRDSRIRAFHTANAGISAARNLGLAQMTGDYIQFLDSDDYLAPTALEDALQAMESQQADMVIFDAYYTGMGADFHETSSILPGVYDSTFILKRLAGLEIPPYACNKFCRKSLYRDVRFPEDEKWEDVATTFYPVSRAGKIAVVGKPRYYYRQRAEATTKVASADHTIYKWRYIQYRKRYEYIKKHAPSAAPEAKTSVLANGLKYYAWFSDSMTKEERMELRRYLCSREFSNNITSKKAALCRASLRLFPRLTCRVVRDKMQASDQ